MKVHGILMLVSFIAASLPGSLRAEGPNPIDLAVVREKQALVREDVEAGTGVFAKLDSASISRLLQHQDRVEAIIEGVDDFDALSGAKQAELINELEAIQAIANRTPDERVVCERYKPTGSKRPITTCRTAAQRAAEREAGQGDINRPGLTCGEMAQGHGGCRMGN
ncbi:hypothetical protein [Luteimonas vadosa]|uniref:Secreted protein n=1 Tax=Luteimonas vadosa TaxID=1165507 RepID=A0ABP9DX52_9GAMM